MVRGFRPWCRWKAPASPPGCPLGGELRRTEGTVIRLVVLEERLPFVDGGPHPLAVRVGLHPRPCPAPGRPPSPAPGSTLLPPPRSGTLFLMAGDLGCHPALICNYHSHDPQALAWCRYFAASLLLTDCPTIMAVACRAEMTSLRCDPLSTTDPECGSVFRNQSTAGVRAGRGCGEIRCVTTSPYIDLGY